MTTTSFDDVLTLISDVEGWLTEDQGRMLFGAATRCRPSGRIVEIGSFRGRSTIVLASGAPDDVEVIAIDPHAGNDRGPQEFEGFSDQAATDAEVFAANLRAAGLTDRVRHVARFSDDAHGEVSGPISVLYVDGAHRYGPARRDLDRWGARVEDGGTLLIHDSFSSIGVTLAIFRVLVGSARYRYLGRAGSLTAYTVGPVTPTARVTSAARQIAQLPWFVRNVVIKTMILAGLGRATRLLGHREPNWPY